MAMHLHPICGYASQLSPHTCICACAPTQNLAESALVVKRAQLDIVDVLRPIAEELGCSQAQLALAWCIKEPRVSSVITGATKLSQVCRAKVGSALYMVGMGHGGLLHSSEPAHAC